MSPRDDPSTCLRCLDRHRDLTTPPSSFREPRRHCKQDASRRRQCFLEDKIQAVPTQVRHHPRRLSRLITLLHHDPHRGQLHGDTSHSFSSAAQSHSDHSRDFGDSPRCELSLYGAVSIRPSWATRLTISRNLRSLTWSVSHQLPSPTSHVMCLTYVVRSVSPSP